MIGVKGFAFVCWFSWKIASGSGEVILKDMRLTVFLAGLLVYGMLLPVAPAQNAGFTPRQDADQVPSYELVSIHKTPEAAIVTPYVHEDPDGLTAGSSSLRSLIGEAYGFSLGSLSDQQLVGAPGWAKTQLFDIHQQDWSDELCALFGVPKANLPNLSLDT